MHSNEFEDAFANFIDRREYDEAESALFAIVRSAFLAGWLAAGGRRAKRAISKNNLEYLCLANSKLLNCKKLRSLLLRTGG